MFRIRILFVILFAYCLLPVAKCQMQHSTFNTQHSTFNEEGKEKKADWLPRGNLYPTCRFDFKESQMSGAIYGFYSNGQWQNRIFGIFSAGLRRNVIRWQHAPERSSELGFEISVFTQFLFEDPFTDFHTNIFNIDFKVGGHYQYRLGHWAFRGRIYHISAHLGDDYIFRYGIDDYIDNPRIYEAIDVSAARLKNGWQLYASAGVIFHTAYPRDPLLLQCGAQYERAFGEKDWLRWIAGADIRMEQEQSFRPGIHTGAGIVLGKKDRFPITIILDYYNGYMPYSLYDDVLMQWLGASLYFDPF